MKLAPGINFINVLRAAFTEAVPKRVKIMSSHQYLFTLLGSACLKAAHKILMKLTTGVNFINILFKTFSKKMCFEHHFSNYSLAL